jgi:methyl-accepting chemotaxis protein
MNALFLPAIQLTQRFKIAHKLSLLLAAFALPFLLIMTLYVYEMLNELGNAKDQLKAVQIIQQQQSLTRLHQRYRAAIHRALSGSKELESEIADIKGKIKAQIQELDLQEKGIPKQSKLWVEYQHSWEAVQAKQKESKIVDSFAAHDQLIRLLEQLSRDLANSSKLNLDSDLTTHELANIYTTVIPDLQEKNTVLGARGAAYIDSGLFQPGEDVMLNSLVMLTQHQLDNLKQLSQQLADDEHAYANTMPVMTSAISGNTQFLERTKSEVLNSYNQTSGTEFWKAAQNAVTNLDKINNDLSILLGQRLEQKIQEKTWDLWKLCGSILLLFVVSTYASIGMYMGFSRELANLIKAAELTAAGDLRHNIAASGKDELAQLVSAFGKMNKSLNVLVTDIRSSASTVETIATEIHRENSDLAERTDTQANSLHQTAESIAQLTVAVNNNTHHSDQVQKLISASASNASSGNQVMSKAILSMQAIQTSSGKMSEIVSVMDGIAFQTNLLAINSAVEAARVGPAGRGFAALATEVRNLAQRSASAATEIKALIRTSNEQVQQGNQLIRAAGAAMDEIVKNIQQSNSVMQDIASTCHEQSQGIAKVNQAITNMEKITSDNTRLVIEASTSIESLEQQAYTLTEAVTTFKTADSATVDQGDAYHHASIIQQLPKYKSAIEIIPARHALQKKVS